MKAKVFVILAMMVLGACGAPVNSSKYKPPGCDNPKVRVKHVDTRATLEQFYIENR